MISDYWSAYKTLQERLDHARGHRRAELYETALHMHLRHPDRQGNEDQLIALAIREAQRFLARREKVAASYLFDMADQASYRSSSLPLEKNTSHETDDAFALIELDDVVDHLALTDRERKYVKAAARGVTPDMAGVMLGLTANQRRQMVHRMQKRAKALLRESSWGVIE